MWRFLITGSSPEQHVDVDDYSRRQAIQESEHQAMLNAQSRVLRVSGQRRPTRRLPCLLTWERQR